MGMFNRKQDSHDQDEVKNGMESFTDLIQSPYIPFILCVFTMSFMLAEKTYDYTANQKRTLDLVQGVQINIESLKTEMKELKRQEGLSIEEHRKQSETVESQLKRIEFKIIELEKILVD